MSWLFKDSDDELLKKFDQLKSSVIAEIKAERNLILNEVKIEATQVVTDMMVELFNEETPEERWGRLGMRETIKGALIRRLEEGLTKIKKEEFRSEAKDYVGGEEFLDKLVERLQRKQLK